MSSLNDFIEKDKLANPEKTKIWQSALNPQELALIEQNNQALKLSKLAEAARELTTCRTTQQVINQVLDSIMGAIEAADSGIFYLYDETTGFLTVQSARGFKDDVYAMRIRPGEIMSGKAFLSGKASIYHTREESLAVSDNFTQPNETVFYQASGGQPPISALSAPLMLQNEPIGVIILDNFKVEHAFTNIDLDILQLLANQAAVAIDNVRLYEHQTQLVYRQEQALRVHNNLTQTVLQGRGIDGIVIDLSLLIENPVVFFDRNAEIQSASQTDLPEPLLEHLTAWLVQHTREGENKLISQDNPGSSISSLTSNTFPITLDTNLETKNTLILKVPRSLADLLQPRSNIMVSPVNVGGEVLGWVMAIPLLKPFDERESLVIEYASTVFGLECMKQQAIFEVQARAKADLIDDLQAGHLSSALDRRAKELGIDFNAPIICICIDIDNFSGYIENYQLNERAIQNIKVRIYQKLDSLIKSTNSISFIGTKSDSYIVFLNLASLEIQGWKTKIRQVAGELQSWIEKVYQELTVSIAVSGVYTGASEMLTALNETQQILELYQRTGRTNCLFFTEEIGADRVLLQLPNNPILESFVEHTLGPILEYDKINHTDLLVTLFTYCANNRSIPETARALATHANTIRYRIERINEVLNDALKFSEGLFNIELAIRILQLRGKTLS